MFLLGGCAGLLRDVYIVSLFYHSHATTYAASQVNSNVSQDLSRLISGAQLEVRIGYFGMCVSQGDAAWKCSGAGAKLAGPLDADGDPLNLIYIGTIIKDTVIFPYFM